MAKTKVVREPAVKTLTELLQSIWYKILTQLMQLVQNEYIDLIDTINLR